MPTVYMRLTTGDEIMGEVASVTDLFFAERVKIEEPLLLDYVSVRKQQLVFLSRYSPFTAGIMIRAADVMVVNEVTPLVAEYYQRSLEYIRNKSDLTFQSGITRSTEFIRKLAGGEPLFEAETDENEEDDISDEFSDFEIDDSTRH